MQKTTGISKSFTLGKKERLKSRKLIERVFREGKSFAVFPFRVYYLQVSGHQDPAAGETPSSGPASEPLASEPLAFEPLAFDPPSSTSPFSAPKPGNEFCIQAAFSASSRNFKRAVDRNRIKRLMREAYRLQKEVLVRKEQPSPGLPGPAALPKKERCFAVFFIYTGKDLPDYRTVYDKIGLTLQKLGKHFGS